MNSKTCQLGAFTSWMVPPETITARLRGSRDGLILRSFWFGHASPWGKKMNRWWGSVQRLVCIGFLWSCFDGFKTWKRRPLAWYEHKNDHSGHSSEECPTSPEKNRCVLFPHFSKDFLWLLYVFAAAANVENGNQVGQVRIGNEFSTMYCMCLRFPLSRECQGAARYPLALARGLGANSCSSLVKGFQTLRFSPTKSHPKSTRNETFGVENESWTSCIPNWHDSTSWKQSFQNLP